MKQDSFKRILIHTTIVGERFGSWVCGVGNLENKRCLGAWLEDYQRQGYIGEKFWNCCNSNLSLLGSLVE